MSKDKEYIMLINTQRWRLLRRNKLQMDPLCERCRDAGRVTAATEVHHITPVEDGLTLKDKERLMYNIENLQSLCHTCHVQAHVELGRTSKQGNERRTQSKLQAFVNKFFPQ